MRDPQRSRPDGSYEILYPEQEPCTYPKHCTLCKKNFHPDGSWSFDGFAWVHNCEIGFVEERPTHPEYCKDCAKGFAPDGTWEFDGYKWHHDCKKNPIDL